MRTSKQIKEEIRKLQVALKKAEARELKAIQKSCNHGNLEYYEANGHNESYPIITCLDCQKNFDLITLDRGLIYRLEQEYRHKRISRYLTR